MGIEELDIGAGPFDWFAEVADVILANQNVDGSFAHINPSLTEGEEAIVLRTAWALLTLEKFVVPYEPETTFEKDFRYTNVNWDRHLIFSEDFSSCGSGWTEDPAHDVNWYCSYTDFAGGLSPEYALYWNPEFVGFSWFMSPAINTVGLSGVEMSFKHAVYYYEGGGLDPFTLGVQASPDGTNWYTAFERVYTADTPAETAAFMLPVEAINSPTTYVRFFFDGDMDDFTYWNIDDIEVYACANLGGLLPMDIDGNYLVDVVVAGRHDRVKSTNPGQLYGVISITGPVSEVYIEDNFDLEFDINPAHIGGGIEILIVDSNGCVEVITDYPGVSAGVFNWDPWNDASISIDLIEAIGEPLPPDHVLMIYVKFKTAMKHEKFESPYDNEFWNRPWIWINDMEPYIDDPFELEALIELTEK
jgi:hypothetical protein